MPDVLQAHIDDLTHEAQGVTRVDNKTVFVDGALPGEDVSFTIQRKKRNFDEARLVEVLTPSEDRIEPKCEYFGVCGGCSFQHIKEERQISYKENHLTSSFRHVAGLEIPELLPALDSELHWGYRTKARLGVKWVKKKGRVLVGFREKRAPYIVDMNHCEILPKAISDLISAFAELIAGLSNPMRIPQIELACTDSINAFVLRHLYDFNAADRDRLMDFARQHQIALYTQRGGPDTIKLLYPEAVTLEYALAPFDIRFEFEPTDFTQVNQSINPKMVQLALDLLEPGSDDKVLELFSGLGNFSLPIAQKAGRVLAIEGDKSLVERATLNAARNDITNIEFKTRDLYNDAESLQGVLAKDFNKLFLDPPRSGADQVLPVVINKSIQRIVYVSCNPATLARDARMLVEKYRFKLLAAGVMDMFPQTSHVESIALFSR